MMPIGPLMVEHRLIERVVKLMGERGRMIDEAPVNVGFVDSAVEFMRTYADRCHHGKEEGILFRGVRRKSLKPEHAKAIDELIKEHVYGRGLVGQLAEARSRYVGEDEKAAGDVRRCLLLIAEFYPKHIEKEDKRFFMQAMDYFSGEEQDIMLMEMREFDRSLIHERYGRLVEELEGMNRYKKR